MAPRRPFRRRRLGKELAAERARVQKTAEQVAHQTEMAASTITRIEGGKMGAKLATIKAILDVYQVPDERRQAILELARHSNNESWWQPYSGGVLPSWFELYLGLEEEAEALGVVDPQYVNGLVQTEDYARALYRAGRPDETDETIDRLVAIRLGRQRRLVEGEMSLRLILDESALDRKFGDDKVMTGQIRHLLELAELRRVEVQLLPLTGQPGIIGGFTILEFPDEADPSVVYIEHEAGAWYLEKATQIRQYARAYDRLRAAARSPQASVAHLAKLIGE